MCVIVSLVPTSCRDVLAGVEDIAMEDIASVVVVVVVFVLVNESGRMRVDPASCPKHLVDLPQICNFCFQRKIDSVMFSLGDLRDFRKFC